MTTTLYGIKNCDKVRAARRWLEQHEIEHRFRDFREDGLKEAILLDWLDELGADKLLNKRSTTWKQLSDAERADLDREKAARLMLEHPTLIKRPVLDTGAERHLGFSERTYALIFKHHTL